MALFNIDSALVAGSALTAALTATYSTDAALVGDSAVTSNLTAQWTVSAGVVANAAVTADLLYALNADLVAESWVTATLTRTYVGVPAMPRGRVPSVPVRVVPQPVQTPHMTLGTARQVSRGTTGGPVRVRR